MNPSNEWQNRGQAYTFPNQPRRRLFPGDLSTREMRKGGTRPRVAPP